MISCTEFIPAYSELFKYIEEKGGKEAVRDFWLYLSENFLTNLKELAEQDGIDGCFEYWSKSLSEEAADFTMELDEENGEFRIEMHHCPSKGRLLEYGHIEPYRDYCEHCDILYRHILEPLGFKYSFNMSECDKAKCSLLITKV